MSNPYAMVKPCDNCPFRRGTSMRLTEERVEEIAGMMLSSSGGEFPCHKTTKHDYEGNHSRTGNEIHCAGALIFAEKNNTRTQMMRIAGRLGMYDPGKLQPHLEDVFDDIDEMKEAIAE